MKNNLSSSYRHSFTKGLLSIFFLVLLTAPFHSQASISFPDKIDTLGERINVQEVLNTVMTPSPNLVIDGVLGRKSIQATQAFQDINGLVADGKIGPITRDQLEKAQTNTLSLSECSSGALFSITTGKPCGTLTSTLSVIKGGSSGGGGGGTPSKCSGSATQSCSITNGTGTQSRTCNGKTWSSYGTCTVVSCNSGYQISGNSCVATTDTTKPVVSDLIIPTTSNSLTIPITTFTATDNIAVTGYLLTESSSAPLSSDSSWASSSPTNYIFSSSGSKTLYAWAKDAAGNVSVSLSKTVTVTIDTRTIATTFYVSSSGNDLYDGLTTATPWQSLTKVNAQTFLPGDSILFNRGDTFYGSITVSQSGTAGNPITFSSYGTGTQPVITGFTAVSEWTNLGSNIWESTSAVSTLNNMNMVVINGVNTAMGRYPNTGYLTYQSFSTNTSITSSSLNSKVTNWTDAEAVIKKMRWIIDRNPITAHSGGTLTYSSESGYNTLNNGNYNGKNNWGFFIQNDSRTLDTLNEWYYNSSTKKIRIYSIDTPTNVQVATQDTLVFMTYKNYITFDNIQFTGANSSAIYAGSSANLTIQNNNFDFNYNGIKTQNLGGSSANSFVNNNTINHSNNNAVNLTDEFTNATVTNNIIQNSGMLVGMSGSGDSQAEGLTVRGASSLVQYNQVINSGFNGIDFRGTSTQVKNNFINYSCIVKDDGGGIYTYNDATADKIVSFNTVLNSVGNNEGANDSLGYGNSAFGIYLDNNSSNVSVLNNSIANSGNGGIFLHDVKNIIMRNNTVYNSGITGLLITEDGRSSFYTTNLTIENNIFFVRNAPVVQNSYGNMTTDFNQLAFKPVTIHNNIASWGTIDSNYYARPIDDNLVFNVQPTGGTATPGLYLMKTLATWQSYSGFDANSHKSPKVITDVNDILFDYNATAQDKTVSLGSSSYIDVTGATYSGSVTLSPYTSIILIKQGTVQGASTYDFTLNLKYGSTGNEVKELQKILISSSYLTGIPDGLYGTLTLNAAKEYQKANNLTPDGIIGSLTREILNK